LVRIPAVALIYLLLCLFIRWNFYFYSLIKLIYLILNLMGNFDFICLRSDKLGKSRIDQYHGLFQHVFKFPKPAGLFERQFLNPHSIPGYHALMIVDGIIQASYGAIPMNFVYQGQEISAALVVDALVHPQYQGQGYLRRVLDVLYDQMKSDAFHFLYGMPNATFYPMITNYLGWQDLGQMHWSILFPGSSVPLFKAESYCYRIPSEAYSASRYVYARERIFSGNRFWTGKTPLPGINLLLDWDSRDPHQADIILSGLNRNRLLLFPFLGQSSQGFFIPDIFKQHRTRVVGYSLSDFGRKILDSKTLWFTLGDFDVGGMV
jgi:GNAT superfamily N-acetyltransferase